MHHILAAMVQVERHLTCERTMADIALARELGDDHCRPQTMTPERIEKVTEMVDAGSKTIDVLAAMQAMRGPKIGRSRVCMWVKKYKTLQELSDDVENR